MAVGAATLGSSCTESAGSCSKEPEIQSDGVVQTTQIVFPGVKRMQGALSVWGDHFVSSSEPKLSWPQTPGTLFVGTVGGKMNERGWPAYPEDLHYSPFSDNLWCLNEQPYHRYVFAVKRQTIWSGCID